MAIDSCLCVVVGKAPHPAALVCGGQLLAELFTAVESWHKDEFTAFSVLQPPREAWAVLRSLDPDYRTEVNNFKQVML